jgi:hypothetical protein
MTFFAFRFSKQKNLCSAFLSLCLTFAICLSGFQIKAQQAADISRLEVIEDLSESLANDLLDLSVATRDKNLKRISDFFPDTFQANAFLCRPLEVKTDVKWIGTRAWAANEQTAAHAVDAKTLKLTKREDYIKEWTEFLNHFLEIEDSRFKVKAATFDGTAKNIPNAETPTAAVGASGNARIAFYVIGRNKGGKREWSSGVIFAKLRYAETKVWQFESFNLDSLSSLVADTDLFSEVSVPAGVAATLPSYSGGFIWHGATASDVNRDGFVDLFVTSPNRNFLYLNDGKGKFADASKETGVLLLRSGVAPLFVDYDNDGDQDLFISNVGQQSLLENRFFPDGKLEFTDVSLESNVAKDAIGFSAVAGDVNGDGFQDIYVTSYNRYGQVVPDSWFRATNGTANLLFVNQKDGTFKEEAAKWGVQDTRWSYAAAFADVNGDGKQDLYVANDFGEKAMFINKGDKFDDEAKERGVLDPGNGMGVSFGDYNNDGFLDLHATNMSSTAGNRILSRLFPNSDPKNNVLKKLAAGNNLYQNLGNGFYRDVTADVGGFSGGWAWGGGFIDFDNDGWEDLFTPNGFISGKSMKDT